MPIYTPIDGTSLIAQWWQQYNRMRPALSVGYRSPAPKAMFSTSAAPRFAGVDHPLSAAGY